MFEQPTKEEFESHYALWQQFRQGWSLERLNAMTLNEYTQAGSKDTFTYWIEAGLENLGSIWGGSAFKFGIFSRKDKSEKEDGAGAAYSDRYGWYSKYGADEQAAFVKIRAAVVAIAEAAQRGDLEAIEAVDLGQAVKWKIAFHYQDLSNPCIVDVFKPAWLRAFLGATDSKLRMCDLQRMVLATKGEDEGILEFGWRIVAAWKNKALAIWKISHGGREFSADERAAYLSAHQAVIHEDTAIGQGKAFKDAPDGSLIYLCHGNSIQLLGRLTGAAVACDKGPGWVRRPYEVLKKASLASPYEVSAKKWTPRGNSTFWEVPANELPEFEQTLLKPYFGINLEDIMELDATSAPSVVTVSSEPMAVGALNRILYGPPGTGKTYRAVAEAVAIVEAEDPVSLMAPDAYANTKTRFDRYREQGHRTRKS